jgi:hypothetical protein
VSTVAGASIDVAGTATFNGPVSGGGNFGGGGTVLFQDAYRPGDSPAAVGIDGNVEFGANASFQIEIGGLLAGGEHDQVNVTGAAALGGHLEVVLINAFMPSEHDVFEILTYNSHSGEFPELVADYLGQGLFLDPVYTGNDLTLLATQAGLGDTDLDGDVDLADLGNLATSYGLSNAAIDWVNGDFDHDDDVDLSDLGTLATFYGSGEAQAYADFQMLLAVPEPQALLYLLLICGSFPSPWRRQCRIIRGLW